MPPMMYGMIWGIVLHKSVILVRWWLNITLLIIFCSKVLFLVWSMKTLWFMESM